MMAAVTRQTSMTIAAVLALVVIAVRALVRVARRERRPS